MKIAKVDEMIKAAFDSMNGSMISWIDARLKDEMSAYDIDKLATELPYNRIDKKQIIKQIDNLPLTRADYDDYIKYATTAVKEANNKLGSEYNIAMSKLEHKFKNDLKHAFSYGGKNKDKVFDVLYSKAYDNGHSNGYTSIKSEFDDLADLLNDAFKAADINTNTNTNTNQ